MSNEEPTVTLSFFPGAVFSQEEVEDIDTELREKVLGWVGHIKQLRRIREQAKEFGDSLEEVLREEGIL